MGRGHTAKNKENSSGLLSLRGLPSLLSSTNLSFCSEPRDFRSMPIIFCFVLFALSTLFFALSLEAAVTGECNNCHTMHNSQGGQPMIYLAPGETDISPKETLLRGTCLGCHGRGPANIVDNTPQILHTGTDLAGGNFAYITGAKSRIPATEDFNRVGHNVIDLGATYQDIVLTSPPGDQHVTGITNTNFTCSGAKGCHGDRAEEDKLLSLKGAHHTDDTVLKFGTNFNEDSQGGITGLSYRFLKGVKGGEDSDWQASVGCTDHNEYKGETSMGSSNLTYPVNNTISGLCAECHGYFHGTTPSETGSASPWFRHPTDIILPGEISKEYRSYNEGTGTDNPYSLDVPVARVNIPDAPSCFVNPGTDDAIAMCLSCHRAHASPYFKMMRWDYKGWPACRPTCIDGCNVCHTSKN